MLLTVSCIQRVKPPSFQNSAVTEAQEFLSSCWTWPWFVNQSPLCFSSCRLGCPPAHQGSGEDKCPCPMQRKPRGATQGACPEPQHPPCCHLSLNWVMPQALLQPPSNCGGNEVMPGKSQSLTSSNPSSLPEPCAWYSSSCRGYTEAPTGCEMLPPKLEG